MNFYERRVRIWEFRARKLTTYISVYAKWFTTENDYPNLARRLSMAFSNLVKQNHNIFLQKQYDGVRANIEQKPHRASLSAILQFYHILFFYH